MPQVAGIRRFGSAALDLAWVAAGRYDGYWEMGIHAWDIAAGMLLLARAISEQPQLTGEAFNFGGGERLSVLDVVGRILDQMGTDLEPDVRNEAANEIAEQRVGADKAGRILGWKPSYSLDEGLGRTISWYRSYLRAAS